MKAVVLQPSRQVVIEDIPAPGALAPDQVRIQIRNVGICGSDVHYVNHGRIGPFVVEQPMLLGHEAAGVITEVGSQVRHLQVGDRVCMEPGVPDLSSPASRRGLYNLDPAVTFWATPPVDGCLTEEVLHPAAFTYRLPEQVSLAEWAMVEPLSIGMQAATKARIQPGDLAVVIGAGTIGIMTALAALSGGCSQVIIADLQEEKLALIRQHYPAIRTVNIRQQPLLEVVQQVSSGWGANIVLEASGSARAFEAIVDLLCPGGCLVLVGMPPEPVAMDVVALQSKEIRIESVFRYANQFERALALIASGRISVKPLISRVYPFAQSVEAFARAVEGIAGDVKIQIELT